MQRALTGIKPTGNVHLGNWLGAIGPAIKLQHQYDGYYFIADYHAMTSVKDGEQLKKSRIEHAATWLALGLDPERAVLFCQSAIPEVLELAWILACQTPIGMMERGHAVKAAREGGREINAGTWFYPLLMAADILLYDSAIVPVGSDQRQHVEIARDLAVKMNHHYGADTLVVPTSQIRDDVGVIPGMDGRKMSASYGNEIPLWLDPKPLRKKVMKIVTDSAGVDEVKDPSTCSVFHLHSLVASAEATDSLRAQYLAPGMGYGHAKQALFEALNDRLGAPREAYHDWMNHPERVEEVLAFGADRARSAAKITLERFRSRVGLA